MHKIVDRAGETRGKLTAISAIRGKRVRWLCVCECGRFTSPLASAFKRDEFHSCGLCRDYAFGDGKRAPSDFPRSWRSTFDSWWAMVNRCYNTHSADWKNWGGRGIRVCDRWLNSPSAFIEDMGVRPLGMTLDRIDVDGHYQPGNCRWADHKTQSSNKRNALRLTAFGSTRLLAEWSAITGVGCTTIRERLCRGWSIEDAVSVPPLKKGLEIRYNVAERRSIGERLSSLATPVKIDA